MRKKLTAFIALIVVVFLVLPLAGQAEIRENSFSLSPVVGGFTFDGAQDLKTRPVYGGTILPSTGDLKPFLTM